MGPYTYGRGSIIVKIEKYLNDDVNVGTLKTLLEGAGPARVAEPDELLGILGKLIVPALTVDEIAHLAEHYFGVRDPSRLESGRRRFECYRNAFLIALSAAEAAATVGMRSQFNLSWACGQSDACGVNWSDATVRLINIAIMSSLIGKSLVPLDDQGQVRPAMADADGYRADVERGGPATDTGAAICIASADATLIWDVTADHLMGNGEHPLSTAEQPVPPSV